MSSLQNQNTSDSAARAAMRKATRQLSAKLVFPACLTVLTVTLLLCAPWPSARGQNEAESSAVPLPAGEPVSRAINIGETHHYRVTLAAGEFLQVRVEQKGVDIKLRLSAPDGALLTQMDSPNGVEGFEIASLVAATAGSYTVEVIAHEQNTKGGNYVALRETGRVATAQDLRRVEIEKVFASASAALDSKQVELALAKFEVALAGWQEVKDDYMSLTTAKYVADLKQALKQSQPQMTYRHIVVGQPVKSQIKNGEIHIYTTGLKQGEVLRAEVKEDGADVSLVFMSFTESSALAQSSFASGEGRKVITFIAPRDDVFALGLGLLSPADASAGGSYEMVTSSRPAATEEDQKRVSAQEATAGAVELLAKKGIEATRQGVAKLEEAAASWAELREEYTSRLINPRLDQFRNSLAEQLSAEAVKQIDIGTPESMYLALSQLEEALTLYEKLGHIPKQLDGRAVVDSLAPEILSEKLGFKVKQLDCITKLMSVAMLLGEHRKVIDFNTRTQNYNVDWRIALGEKSEQEQRVTLAMSATSEMGIANAYSALGEYKKAFEHYNRTFEAVKRWEAHMKSAGSPSPSDKVIDTADILLLTHWGLAEAYSTQGNKAKALENYTRALHYARLTGNKERLISGLNFLASFHLTSGEREKASRYSEQAMRLLQAGDKSLSKSFTLTLTGTIYYDNGDNANALKYYLQALNLTDAEQHKAGQGVEALLNKYTNAAGRAVSLNQIAVLYWRLGDSQKAREYLSQALNLSKVIKNNRYQAKLTANLGEMYKDTGDLEDAMQAQTKALSLLEGTGDKRELARVLREMGHILYLQGDARRGIERFEESARISDEVGNNAEKLISLAGLGAVYSSLGEREKSLGYHKEALKLAEAMDIKAAVASQYDSLGSYYYEWEKDEAIKRGYYDEAIKYYKRALEIYRLIGDKDGEGHVLNNVGNVYQKKGDYGKALEDLEGSLRIFEVSGKRAKVAAVLDNIGNVYTLKGDPRAALPRHAKSLALLATTRYFSGAAYNYRKLQDAWAALSKLRLAIFYGKLAVNKYQELRQGVRGDNYKEAQQAFIKANEKPYHTLVGLLIAEGRLGEAQQVINIYRDQEFFDVNLPSDQLPPGVDFTPREAANAELLRKSLDDVGNAFRLYQELKRKVEFERATADDDAKLKRLAAEHEKAVANLEVTLKQIEADFDGPVSAERDRVSAAPDPDQAKDVECRPRPDSPSGGVPDAERMKYALCKLEESDEAAGAKYAVIYTLSAEDTFYALLITRDGIKAFSNSTKAFDWKGEVNAFLDSLKSPFFSLELVQERGAKFYDLIFKSKSVGGGDATTLEAEVEKYHPDVVLWSLDGRLRYIAMAALYDRAKQQYLVEKFQSAVFTRARKERLLQEPEPWTEGVGLGVSEAPGVTCGGEPLGALPRVVYEMPAIFNDQPAGGNGVLKGKFLLNKQFTFPSMLNQLKAGPRLVHISSHFCFEPGDVKGSFLLLGDNGRFSLYDMQGVPSLFAGVELLALSACETAAQRPNASGKEIDSFAELAQRSGAHSVIATLWKGSDVGMSQLMIEFYKLHTAEPGLPKAALLRRAQLKLLSGEVSASDSTSLAHPHYWAPFVLYGGFR